VFAILLRNYTDAEQSGYCCCHCYCGAHGAAALIAEQQVTKEVNDMQEHMSEQ
jgi:hypothetical protein